jgi:hypothetical protein
MIMGILALFFYYVGMCWHEWERLLAIVIKEKYKKANKRWSCPWEVKKRERRCNRGIMPRGRSGDNNFSYKNFI